MEAIALIAAITFLGTVFFWVVFKLTSAFLDLLVRTVFAGYISRKAEEEVREINKVQFTSKGRYRV